MAVQCSNTTYSGLYVVKKLVTSIRNNMHHLSDISCFVYSGISSSSSMHAPMKNSNGISSNSWNAFSKPQPRQELW